MRSRRFFTHPATIAVAYAVFSIAWIFLIDLALGQAELSRSAAEAINIGTDCLFVIGTTGLIYYLLRKTASEREGFRALVESAPDAMVIIDRGGNITLVNAQTERLFGYSRSELIGKKIECLIPERFRGQHSGERESFFTAPRARQMRSGFDLIALRKDGSEFPADISLSPIRTADGVLVCSDIRDISERQQTEEEIKSLNSKLEQALRRSEKLAVTGGLIATLAHEINNPLESMGNLLFLIGSMPETGDGTKQLVAEAEQELARLTTLTRQTLAPHRENKVPVSTKLTGLLDDVIAQFDRKLKRAGIEVIHDYQSDGEVTIFPSDFRQVFANLISNAIDAMGQGGRLHLTVERSPDAEVIVHISDTGCGIASEHLDNIFEPFFTTKGEKGTGLGLWVIKGIVEKIGGTIAVVSSETGETGTCFSIYLPETKAATQAK